MLENRYIYSANDGRLVRGAIAGPGIAVEQLGSGFIKAGADFWMPKSIKVLSMSDDFRRETG